MITTRGLARSFKSGGQRIDAVKGVDIDVPAGEGVTLLGPNGAGKTTSFRMLTTLIRPTAGTATVAGHDLLADPAGVRRRIGYVAQGGGTNGEHRVHEEIELQGQLYGMSRAEARRRAGEVMEQLDLTELRKRLVKTLSGGQRRRLDIALGLVHSPPVVFLDEPTTGLDPQSRAALWRRVHRLRSELGTTVFVTTHYLEEADAFSDRVIIIDHGRIIAEGTPEALKAKVAGHRVEITVPIELIPSAVAVTERLADASNLFVVGDSVRFQVPKADVMLPHLIRALDFAQIPTMSIQVVQPTLDDIFLLLTGRSFRDDANSTGM
ncbi:ABC-2 type transport system ATP-binding protein [Streptosporangium album]|uniref:ABC-2 type transport system ATP-binding protein n=1 Tax=Streptosporangium album TaxID=47479 RepID=A0A7W7S5F9_9ACTN|nr:ATP-binding cassette domain-containing protein [Streptosporangium album]MBB4944240.1 ABC-2 type transport system ATP-binding protein [Streptosporangium album]